MPRHLAVLAIIGSLLFATSAYATVTVDPSYNAATDTWNYYVTMDTCGDLGTFYVYMDPNMQYSYLANIGNDAGWGAATFGTRTTDPWSGLTYLKWTRPGDDTTTTAINFYFSDAADNMDLVNHPGPLLFNDPNNANAYSTYWVNLTGGVEGSTSYGSGDEAWNPITPEPGTIALFGIGVLGLAARLRRQQMT